MTKIIDPALAAAYARVNDVVKIVTLELSFDNIADKVRLYVGGKPDSINPDGVEFYGHDGVGFVECLQENGTLAKFYEMPFEIVFPNEDTKVAKKASLKISHANAKISEFARLAQQHESKIYAEFRGYIWGEHQNKISEQSRRFELKHLNLSGVVASAQLILEVPNLFNNKFPLEVWNDQDHSWLAGRSKSVRK